MNFKLYFNINCCKYSGTCLQQITTNLNVLLTGLGNGDKWILSTRESAVFASSDSFDDVE